MKNIDEKTKRKIILVGGIVISIMLIAMIGSQFQNSNTLDVKISDQENQESNVNVDSVGKEEITAEDIEIQGQELTDNGSIDTGTEQKIQGDVSEKTDYTQKQLTDSTQKPNGEKVENTNSVEHNSVANQQTPYKETDTVQGGTTNSKGQTYLPGFGWVENSGENQGEIIDGDGDVNKQVGEMD